MSFAGQNWGPDAQAHVDAGCITAATSAGASVAPTTPTVGTSSTPTDQSEVAGTSVSEAVDAADENVLDAVLPDAGGARLGLLVLALGPLALEVFLVARRCRV